MAGRCVTAFEVGFERRDGRQHLHGDVDLMWTVNDVPKIAEVRRTPRLGTRGTSLSI